MNPEAKKLWEEVRNPECQDCELGEFAETTCLLGDGPVPCRLMIVGEAPGAREDDIGKPFAGRAGKYLDESLEEVGLSRQDFFITNAVHCRPPNNRTPSRGEIKVCRKYLDAEIERVQPEFILPVGNVALSLLRKSGITKHRGQRYTYGEAVVLPTVHPAAVLRNPRYEQLFKTDLQTFSRMVKGEKGAPPPKVFIVKDKKGLEALLKATMKSEAVAYDLETSGFEEWADDAQIATISVAVKPGVAFVVPIHHPEARWKRPERVLGAITVALAYTHARRIAHNAKFDDRWLTQFGRRVRADFDTMVAAHIIDENRPKGLKVLAPIYLGVDPWADVDLSKRGALTTPLHDLAIYNGKDADYTLRLYYKMREELKAKGEERSLRLFVKVLMPAVRALTDIEARGLYVNRKRLAKRIIELNRRLDKLNAKLVKLFGEQANWNSNPQLARLLFSKLQLPLVEMTNTGNPSTKESVLLRLRSKHEAIPVLLEWKHYAKQLSFLDGWKEKVDAGGRMHPNYKVTGTVTGRLSSGKEEGDKGRGLNVQQVPRDPFIRSILGAPAGWKFVEADFSQVELRLAAHYSGDPTLLRYYQLGEDVHMKTAVTMTGKPPERVTKEERKKAKAVNFGFLYGMGHRKFVEYARDNYDVEVSEEEAKDFRDKFFGTFTDLKPWHERQRRLVRKYKRVQSAIGRVRHLPDIDSQDEDVAAEAERQAINSPVQSLASDLMLMSLVQLHEEMDPQEAVIVGTVHDSILLEIREDVVGKWTKRIKEVMENLPLRQKFGVSLKVPIVADVSVSQHWGEREEDA